MMSEVARTIRQVYEWTGHNLQTDSYLNNLIIEYEQSKNTKQGEDFTKAAYKKAKLEKLKQKKKEQEQEEKERYQKERERIDS